MPTENMRFFRTLAAASAGLLMLGASVPAWSAVRAQLERNSVQEGETLTLNIESDAAQSGERPDLAPLRADFEVLGSSTSSESTIVNGRRSARTRWTVRLQPRHSGSLEIPSITVGSERSEPLVLNVAKASAQAANRASRHVFMQVEAAAAGNSVYVQQQIPYTVRLYYDDRVKSGELSAPDPADAVVERLGEEKRYRAVRGGREYGVIERHYAIAPEKSGALRIPSATFRGTALLAQNGQAGSARQEDPMARLLRGTPFANDPFFSGGLGAAMAFADPGQPVVVRGGEITLEVQPRPAGAQGHWLPAEQISVHDSWQDNPPRFKVGEPVTRTVTISAKGLAASQIPPLAFAPPGNARLYPDAPDNQSRTDGKTIYGISKQSVTYIPSAQGRLEVPPVELAWWDTQGNTQRRAALPAREFTVEAGIAGGQAHAAPPAPAAAGPRAASAPTPPAAGRAPLAAAQVERLPNRRAWLGGAAALLAMVILFVAVRRHLRRRGPESAEPAARLRPAPRRKAALRALRQACVGNDRQAAASALLDLARAEWPDDPPRGLAALAARLAVGGKEVGALDRCLYAAPGDRWEGDALWRTLRRGLEAKRGDRLREDDGLEPLYH